MSKPKAALLPFYLALYDKTDPGRRHKFGELLDEVKQGLIANGIDVVDGPICCTASEFRNAIADFENQQADAIVAVHLAYSPSLESAAAIAESPLPFIFVDTTMDNAFGADVEPGRISYNHGIHGVQDLACVLRRLKKPFSVVAGHIGTDGRVVQRAADHVRAGTAARSFNNMRALRIGTSFAGMGDFAVPDSLLLDAFGIHVDTITPEGLAEAVNGVSADDIEAECKRDADRFTVAADHDVHQRSQRIGLGLRALLAAGGYGAFSMNFAAFTDPDATINAVPFLEACKAMDRGLGYAGEGDVVTAPLVGALSAAFGETTFTEMFCPDWAGSSVFLSHMGEVNPAIAAETPRAIELDFPYTPAQNPVALACDYQPGTATVVNLSPGPDNTFTLISAVVDVFGKATHPDMADAVRGWMSPRLPLPEFLETYSHHGGTHHIALVYGDRTEAIEAFGRFTGIPVVTI